MDAGGKHAIGQNAGAGKHAKKGCAATVMMVLAAIIALVVLVACGGAGNRAAEEAGDAGAPAAPTATTTVQGKALGASAFVLSTKITSKECFGSAGCLVQYKVILTIDGATNKALREQDRPYEVTYEVRGFEDGEQIGTLNVDPDGTYTSDTYLSGTLPRRTSKLTIKVTDVRRGL